MSDRAVEVSGLRKSYGAHEVVKGIDLSVARGEVFGFLGTNGYVVGVGHHPEHGGPAGSAVPDPG